MDFNYLTLWPKEYIDKVAPRGKTKREVKKDQKELLENRLSERAVLSDEDIKKYGVTLDKKELINSLKRYNDECYKTYIESKQKFGDYIRYRGSLINPGVPQMILTSLSQYSGKVQKNLLVYDLKIMFESLVNVFPDKIKNNDFKRFRKANNLTFFGSSQCIIMEEYLNSLK